MKQDGWHDTPLHYAAASGSRDTVEALLAWGADASVANALSERGAAICCGLRAGLHAICGSAAACLGLPRVEPAWWRPPACAADATPADVAERAGHKQLAAYLKGVGEGTVKPAHDKEALLQRLLHPPSKSPSDLPEAALARAPSVPRQNGTESPAAAPANGNAAPADGDAPPADGGAPAASKRGSLRGTFTRWLSQRQHDARQADAAKKEASEADRRRLRELTARGFEGWGTEGEPQGSGQKHHALEM